MFIYNILYMLPAIASLGLMLILDGGLGGHHWIIPLWFALAFLAQSFSAVYSPTWVAGIVLQVILAIYLSARAAMQR